MAAERVTIDRAELVELYEGGESVLALAERYGVACRTIDKRLDAAGVERRGASAANFLRAARLTPEQRKAGAAAAHAAKRGRPNSLKQLCRAAVTRQRRGVGIAPSENMLAGWLAARGVATVAQQAIGPYNCDLAAHPVAMEVFGGNWHGSGAHARRYPDRCDYVLDRGWHLAIVWDQARDPLSPLAADYLVAFFEQASRDPSAPREYRVIRGCGEELARGESKFDQLALVPSQRRTPRSRA